MIMFRYLVLPLFSLVLTGAISAQPKAAEIIKNVQAEFGKVKDYSANLEGKLDIPDMKVPDINAKLYFKQPEKVHIESEQFVMLPKDVVRFNPSMFQAELFDMVVQGTATVDGNECYKVKLLARSDTLRVQRALLFVDSKRWLIRKAELDPNQGRSTKAKIGYTLVQKKYYLPKQIDIMMDVPPMQFDANQKMKDMSGNSGKKQAVITLKYSNYAVNKGIPDSRFEEEMK